jgi:hypothetical protein
LVVIFSLTAVFSFAAEEPRFIIKGKNGVCKVIQAKEKTPATIGGPYKTKNNAEKAKDKACAKAGKMKWTTIEYAEQSQRAIKRLESMKWGR